MSKSQQGIYQVNEKTDTKELLKSLVGIVTEEDIKNKLTSLYNNYVNRAKDGSLNWIKDSLDFKIKTLEERLTQLIGKQKADDWLAYAREAK